MNLVRTIESGVIKVLTSKGAKEFPFVHGTDDRKRAIREADDFERQHILELFKLAGRMPTQTELLDGKIAAATDSRTFAEKVTDSKFSPAMGGEQSYLERLLEQADADVERERYGQMTHAEQRREDYAKLLAKREAEADALASHEERLSKYSETIDRLKLRQHGQNWNPESDEKDRQLIRKALLILETPGSDLAPLKPLLSEIDERAETRRINKLAELEQKADALAAQQAAVAEQAEQLGDAHAATE